MKKSKEAFKINGAYLEDLISGYSTIKTLGRERLEKEVETITTRRDGETLKSSRFTTRTIKVDFALRGSSMEDMRSKLKTLNSLLNVEEAVFVFDDESDVSYVGTPILNEDFNDGKNTAYGSFSIFCADPFKYSNNSYVIEGSTSGGVTTLYTFYDGSVRSYPTFDVEFATDETGGSIGRRADCGYVMVTKSGTDYSLQFGDDEEKDSGSVSRIATNFKAETKGTHWNDVSTLPLPSSAYTTPSGATSSFNSTEGVQVSAYGSGSGKYHGPLVVCDLGANMTGEFEVNWKQVFALASDSTVGKKQGGAFGVMMWDESNNLAYAYILIKGNTTSLNGSVMVYSPDEGIKTAKSGVPFGYTSPTGYVKVGGATRKSTNTIRRIQREGKWYLSFNCGHYKDDNFGGWETVPSIRKVGFFFGRYSSNSTPYKNTLISAEVIEGAVNLINSFGSGDVLEVNTETMDVQLNNESAADLGDIGNNWSDMVLEPGPNTFVCQWSDWVTTGFEPTFKMTYKERFL